MSQNRPLDIKIAYVGGGSTGWAPHVLTELALCEHLTGEIALYDVDPAAAQKNVEQGEVIFSHPNAKTTFQITVASTSAEVFKGADFVFLSIQPGPRQMFANDIDIPKKWRPTCPWARWWRPTPNSTGTASRLSSLGRCLGRYKAWRGA